MKYITRGSVIPKGGTSVEYKTGNWRTFRPVIRYEECIRCYICWQFCPEPAIRKVDGSKYPAPLPALQKKEAVEIDYDYCKGCGICVNECPKKSIDFVKEEK